MRSYNTFRLSLIVILSLLPIIPACTESKQNLIYDFTVRNDDQNSLRMIAEWKTTQPATSKVEYRKSGDSDSWLSTPLCDEKVTEHEVIIVGLRGATNYVFRPVSDDVIGTELTVSTEEIPETLPKTQAVIKNTLPSGITIGGFPQPRSTIVAVTFDGEIIWYHQDSDGGEPGDFFVSEGDGRLFYSTYEAIKALDYMGNEEVLLDVESLGEVCHHDFLITPEGNYMYLSRSTVIANDQEWCVDEIVERDTDGNVVWRWRSAEHANELGGFIANNHWQEYYEGGCGYDWTHVNSIYLNINEGKKFVILSIRNMNRVIKIDYPSGDILWQLGDGLDFTFIGAEPEDLRWFHCQHSASYLPDISSILLFDNGNDRYKVETENFSRALVYEIDEVNMTAEISWEYVFKSFAKRGGNIRRLLNGNFLITLPEDQTKVWSAFVEVNESEERIWQTDFIYSTPLETNFLMGNLRVSSLYDFYKTNE